MAAATWPITGGRRPLPGRVRTGRKEAKGDGAFEREGGVA
jgi:hypothetical protein